MSVKIEILDYVYGDGKNLADATTFTSSTALMFSVIDSTTVETFAAGAVGVGYVSNICPVIAGLEYKVSFRISGYGGTQNMGFSASGAGLPLTLRGSSNGNYTDTFVATTNTSLDLFAHSTNSGFIKNISVQRTNVVDWDKSIVGELDVTEHSDFPLALTFQVSDIKDLTSTSGDYSKTFKVPATKNNNQLLKHIYIPNSITDNKVTGMKSCRIIINGLNSLIGLIQVTGVIGYGEKASHYNCTFLGNNLGWASGLHGKYMNNILWGDDGLGLEYKKPNIMATWDDEDCTSSPSHIVYPITSYGNYNPDGPTRTIQLLDTLYANSAWSSSQLGYFGFYNDGVSYGTPPPESDWRPAVFVKNSLDKIFSALGYSISSNFMNKPLFKKLVWLLPNFQYNNPEDREVEYSYGNHFIGNPFLYSFTQTYAATDTWYSHYAVINLNDAGADFVLDAGTNNAGWNAINGEYVFSEYGYYEIKLSNFGLWWEVDYNGGSVTFEYARLRIQVQTVGQTSWNTIINSPITTPATVISGSNGVFEGKKTIPNLQGESYFNKGDKMRIVLQVKSKTYAYVTNTLSVYLFGASSPTSTTTSSNNNGTYSIAIEPIDVAYGQTYDLDKVMSTQDKQVDFIKGVIHAFNLNVTTDEVNKTIYLEPFNDFYHPYSGAIDWTHKLDRSKEVGDKWIKTDLKRRLVFKYKSDGNDAKVKIRGELFFDGVEDEFPYIEELPPTFEQGESIFENPFFAGTYSGKDRDTTQSLDTAWSACLWTENVSYNNLDRPEKGYDFLPRLLYWNKYSPATAINDDKRARVQTWHTVHKNIVADASAPSVLSSIYPQATMTNKDKITSPNLAYGSVTVSDYNDATGVYAAGQTVGGLYDTYYKDMIGMLKKNPRVRTAYVDLKINDISELDFRKLVYIDGVYWRISRVIDYKPHRNESTKVELIEWFEIGFSDANTPLFSGNTSQWGNSNITSNSQTTL